MKFDFKKSKEPVYTQDLYYDLFLGGYIKPEELLSCEEQAQDVREAIELIESFLAQAEAAGAMEAE